MKRIYVVDDEKRIRDLVKMYLEKEQYETETFSNSEDALERFKKEEPDLLVLDIMMDGMDGFDLCREIRKTSEVPIIFVSARGEELDRILGLELGADDYITKPFSPRELVARIKTILKRTSKEPNVTKDDKVLKANSLLLYRDKRAAEYNGKDLDLTRKEYELLEVLMKNINVNMSREEIVQEIWGDDYEGYDRNVDDTVKRLRKKLSDAGTNVKVKTVWGFGYRLDDE